MFALFIALAILWHSARWRVAACAAVVFWLLSAGWLSGILLDFAQPQVYRTPYDPVKAGAANFGPRTAIVMLGGGTEYRDGKLVPKYDVYARIALAAGLHAQCVRAGRTCRVIVSGGNPQHHASAEADNYAPYLLRAGVPRADLVLENRSLTTWQNARNVAPIVRPDDGETLLLVTSAYHMRRAMLDFHRFGMDPLPVVSNVRRVQRGVLPRLANLKVAEIALHELIGIAQFYAYRMLGWF
ncbi:YdcF family protein [Paraburkholderia lycopersici]|uniref:YdcF family protein n=1 Tax=Paraburkholderia lycopersici TaxID=416944 RepID=UPI001FDF547F|nr:YdcF family protein [Paraburkholderia lycopersici]